MLCPSFCARVGYVSIFAGSVEPASDNLVRLIACGGCGFNEGVQFWCRALTVQLQTPVEPYDLNKFGADFTATQWVEIFERVRTALISQAAARDEMCIQTTGSAPSDSHGGGK